MSYKTFINNNDNVSINSGIFELMGFQTAELIMELQKADSAFNQFLKFKVTIFLLSIQHFIFIRPNFYLINLNLQFIQSYIVC